MLNKTRTQWAGHMVRMGNIRLPKKIVFGGLARAGEAEAEGGHAYEHDICKMATAKLVSISRHKTHLVGPTWWILAQDKTLWGACIDKCRPRRPPTPTLPCNN